MDSDAHFMRLALEQGQLAAEAGEVPVGAVLVKDGKVIAVGRNAPITQHDPTAHAEISALRAGAVLLGNYRLDGCELFVTLEPCAMCAGAMLHARLRRVVYGASDPKTGAAGSVVDLFKPEQLNHQTQLVGGVLAQPCADLLHHFFEHKRAINRLTATPLREDALRTPDVRFRYLLDYPWTPRYVSDLKTLSGLRMHYLDENPDTNILPIFLCLHGYRHWSYVFRKMVPTLSKAGHRIVVPDLIGFGKSDKPKREAVHTMAFHQQVLFEFIERLDLHNVILIVQEDIELLAQFLMQGSATRFRGIFKVSKTQSTHEAPFPDDGHRAAVRALSSGESDSPTSSEPDESVAREVLCLFAA